MASRSRLQSIGIDFKFKRLQSFNIIKIIIGLTKHHLLIFGYVYIDKQIRKRSPTFAISKQIINTFDSVCFKFYTYLQKET